MNRIAKTGSRYLAVILLSLCIAALASCPAFAEEPEVLKSTVGTIDEGALYLKDVKFQDETLPKRDIMILLDKETRYLYGTQQVPKEELAPGHLVLVRCTLIGLQRKALMVRIIGGRKADR